MVPNCATHHIKDCSLMSSRLYHLLTLPLLLAVNAPHENTIRYVNDIHWEKAPSNKTPRLTKSTNMGIWVIGTSNQLFLRGS